MTDIMIRNIPDDLAASITEAAQAEGLNREQLLRQLLTERFGKPLAVLAWLRADRPGEVEFVHCPECGQDNAPDDLWFAISSARTLTGPVCGRCAT